MTLCLYVNTLLVLSLLLLLFPVAYEGGLRPNHQPERQGNVQAQQLLEGLLETRTTVQASSKYQPEASNTGIPFGDHPLTLERYREDLHGPCARMTCTHREV